MTTKVCKKCGAQKVLADFPKNSKMPDGHLNACKPCEYARVAAWRAANPDKVKANNEKTRAMCISIPDGVTQICKNCGTEKLLRHFRRARGMKLGVRKNCKVCAAAETNGRYLANAESRRMRAREWRRTNPESARTSWRAYAERNREKRLQERKVWRANNLDKDRAREKRYLQENRPVVYAKNARRRAAETRAAPCWLNAIQCAQIQEFYEISMARAMQTGEKHHVDHIVPLRGDSVNGLHVPWNLQILTEVENCSKHNKFIEARI